MKLNTLAQRLTLTQRQQLLAWREENHTYDQILELIATDFGLRTSRSALARFFQKHELEMHLGDQTEFAAHAAQLTSHQNGPLFIHAAMQSIAARLFTLSLDPTASIRDLACLARILEKQQKLINLHEQATESLESRIKQILEAEAQPTSELAMSLTPSNPGDVANTASPSDSTQTGGACSPLYRLDTR